MFKKSVPPAPAAPPPPKPGTLVIELAASMTLNPDARSRPSPVVTRLYELKGKAQFESADFVSLYEKDNAVLGTDLVARDEFVLRPGERKSSSKPLATETKFVGVFVAFRDLERARWRTVAGVLPNKTNVVTITIEDIAVQAAVTST